ncbi:hypothetical protein CH366_00935 [Leptospira harrisiae]|uniref:Uncharacterized protein n=1 Tax=Leptospira harrisiae TaxID=2023189 RepID=A0A2N0AKV6_9LEPT|nr:hypothetical protein CH364_00935 [Leptospira harrisiae]PKA08380.1 hypothetical protein CH366_00935 [Leptospira harrisiae]
MARNVLKPNKSSENQGFVPNFRRMANPEPASVLPSFRWAKYLNLVHLEAMRRSETDRITKFFPIARRID